MLQRWEYTHKGDGERIAWEEGEKKNQANVGDWKPSKDSVLMVKEERATEDNAGRWGKMKTELVSGFGNLEVTGES